MPDVEECKFVVRRGAKIAVVTAFVAAAMLAGSGSMPMTCALAANDCAASCYAQENACRRSTGGDPSCGSALARCLQGCRSQR